MTKKLILTLCFLLATGLSASPKIFVGIAGGTASGKTTFAQNLQAFFPHHSILIRSDSYAQDFSHISPDQVKYINFDHPDAYNLELLHQHLAALKNDESISIPSYDFISHVSSSSGIETQPAEIILVEGFLLFACPSIRDLFDLKIFIDIQSDIRLLRLVDRDTQERGKDFDHIQTQYLTTTKPMHDLLIEPSKQHADIIVPQGGHNKIALELVVAKLRECLCQ